MHVVSESVLLSRLAEEIGQKVGRRTISQLQRLRVGMQSDDDSVLANIWDEVCVQAQGEESVSWESYLDLMRNLIGHQLSKLKPHEVGALWLQTPEGELWSEEEDRDYEGAIVLEDVVEDVLGSYVLSAACDWKNPRIRKQRRGSCIDEASSICSRGLREVRRTLFGSIGHSDSDFYRFTQNFSCNSTLHDLRCHHLLANGPG